MPQKKRPTLRFFAAFRGNFGHIRAVVRYDNIRKSLLTPLIITKDQLARLDTAGGLKSFESDEDAILHGRLRAYRADIWHVVTPLIESGEFANTPSEHLTTAVIRYRQAQEKAATRRHLEAMGYDTATLKPGFDSPGFHNPDGSRMTPKEEKAFRELLKQNGFGEKGGNDGK